MKLLRNIRLSLYWKCQLMGWSAAALYWGYSSFAAGFIFWLAIIYFITDVASYIFITHQYRNIALRNGWHRLPLRAMVKTIIIAVIILGLAFLVVTAAKIYLLRTWFIPAFSEETLGQFLQANWLAMLMAGIRLMSIWLLAYHLYHYAQREIIIARENARLEVITKEAQLNNLSAQLNPHFFFNSLNNIKSLIIENPSAARRAVDLLADLLRSGLYKKEAMLIPLKDELNMVKDYLELEKLRFEERLQQSIEVDEQLNDTLVLRLSIQTLVENAIKHGIDKQKEGGLVKITVARHGEYIEIRVENPGRLDETKSMHGLGLKNLEERVKLQFKGNGKFKIAANNETVSSTLQMPAT